MKIGVVVSSVSRRAGGLFWSVRALCKSLDEAKHRVTVFSLSDEYSDTDSKEWGNVDVRLHTPFGASSFGYSKGLSRDLLSTQLDVIHTHGLWMYSSLTACSASYKKRCPLIISPRGMLDGWALKNSRWKKVIASALYERRHLRQAACIHALSEAEYRAIRQYGLTNPIAIIPNGVEMESPRAASAGSLDRQQTQRSTKALAFLGRLHPKKGLPELLHAWSVVRCSQPDHARSWKLVIAGWDQAGHEEDLKRLAESLKISDSVDFIGPQFGEEKQAFLQSVDAFILPSHSEGQPMAILEAWAAGLPVLMTDECNLAVGVESGAAIGMRPTTASITRGLLKLFCLSDSDRERMGVLGRELVGNSFAWRNLAKDMGDVYRWIAGDGTRPETVLLD